METVGDHEHWKNYVFLLYFFFIFLVFCSLQVMEIGLLLSLVCQHSNQGLVMKHDTLASSLIDSNVNLK
jgi:hypothetical protein